MLPCNGEPYVSSRRAIQPSSGLLACGRLETNSGRRWTLWRYSSIAVLAVACCTAARALQNKVEGNLVLGQSGNAESRAESYGRWVSSYRAGRLTGGLSDHHQIQMAITIISGDDVEPYAKTASLLGPNAAIVTTRFAVSSAKTVSMVRVTAMAIQGGGPSKLTDQDFKRLSILMADLPDDHSRLPPKGRRLVVQVVGQTGTLARVYDRANLPESVLEMLRIVGADTWPIFPFPDFEPEQSWNRGDFAQVNPDINKTSLERGVDRILAKSPDHSLTVVETNPSQFFDSTVNVEKLTKAREKPFDLNEIETVLRIKDSRSGSVIHEIRDPMNGRSVVYMYAARFTPDGHYLLVMSSIPDIRIYDVFSWQLLSHLPHVPNAAVAYYPSSDWRHAVVALSTGEIELRDSDANRTLAQIDFGDRLQSVSYSSDDSQVAVVTVGYAEDGSYRCNLRTWRTSTGELLHELRPLEATPRDGFGEPVWTPDGKYLLSLTREGHFGREGVVGIWNTESGRYRGALAGGCNELASPPYSRFVLSGKYFYMTCGSDWILKWNVEHVLQEISDFEKSLQN